MLVPLFVSVMVLSPVCGGTVNVQKEIPPVRLIELVYEKPVRGAVEKFYRATAMAYLDQSEWPGVPA